MHFSRILKNEYLIVLRDTHRASFGAAAAKSRQSRPTLCDPIGGSPTGSSVPGILQARTLECKEPTCQYRRLGFDPRVRRIPWRRKWQSTPVFLHGQRSLAGYKSMGLSKSWTPLSNSAPTETHMLCFHCWYILVFFISTWRPVSSFFRCLLPHCMDALCLTDRPLAFPRLLLL